MIRRIKNLKQSRFLRNVAMVATGTAGAQVIAMAFSPLITRIYGPEAFGVLGTFVAIQTIVLPISALTYPIAIVLPKDDADAKGIAFLSLGISAIMASMIALIILMAGRWLAEMLNLQAIRAFLLLIPLTMLFSTFYQILQQWLIRKNNYKITARAAVLKSLALNSAKAGIGWVHPIAAVLIIVTVLDNALHAILLWLGIENVDDKSNMGGEKNLSSITSIITLAKRHRDFPLFRAPQITINSFSGSLPVLMLANFFGAPAAGFYSLGRTVMAVPSTLIGKSVADVFYPRITEAQHNGEDLSRLILKATRAMAVVGFLPFAIVAVFGPILFAFVFGEEWVRAGEYARWMAIWLYFAFLNRPSVAAIATLRLQGFFLVYEFVSLVTRIGALYMGFVVFNSDLFAVALFSIVGVLLNFSLVACTLVVARRISPKGTGL